MGFLTPWRQPVLTASKSISRTLAVRSGTRSCRCSIATPGSRSAASALNPTIRNRLVVPPVAMILTRGAGDHSKAARCFAMNASSVMGGRPPSFSTRSLVPSKMPF